MFIDEVKVYARAGHGGKGCVAFLRETDRAKGGPSGGNGGHGGDVILEADHDLNNLIAQYYKPRLIAECGEPGMGKGMDGAGGKDLIIKVPCGTVVWRLPDLPDESVATESSDDEADPPMSTLRSITGTRPVIRHSGSMQAMEINLSEEEAQEKSPFEVSKTAQGTLVADLTQHGQRFTLCKGGRGGLGNRNFATAARQAPRFAQPGEPGTEGNFVFELRILAEIGLVGYPNAGKSTLLTAISKARPKVAPYPFTTLHPQIGIVEYEDFHRLTVCDVPGLIEGAHRNVGLGHAFLRHIQRCKVLVILLDMSGMDAREPWDDYTKLLKELELYDETMLEKPRLVLANKMDEPTAEAKLKQFKRKVRKIPVLPISAAFGEGVEKFKQTIRDAVAEQESQA
ncbi:MAG: GTPase ObgE [Verrucomicrobiota bacterium]